MFPMFWFPSFVFSGVALVIASRISKQRWAEIAAHGPYSPPIDR